MSDIDFTLTGSGKIELMTESKEHAWIVEITRDGNIRFLKNHKEVEAFPSTPLTKKLMAATKTVHPDAVDYLTKAWAKGGPLDDQEGRALWWKIRDKVKSF